MIYGPAEDRDKFLSDVKAIGGIDVGDEFEFSKSVLGHFFPLPVDATKEIKTDDGKTHSVFSDTGYNTAVQTWGTKWPDSESRITEFPDSLNWKFDSPWGPPGEGLRRLSELYPDLYFADAWKEEQGLLDGFLLLAGCILAEHGGFGFDDEDSPQYPEGDDATEDAVNDYYDKRSEWESKCREAIEDELADAVINNAFGDIGVCNEGGI